LDLKLQTWKIILLEDKDIWIYIFNNETQIKVGSKYIWLWVAIDLECKEIIEINISKERNMFISEWFILRLVKIYDLHLVPTDGVPGISKLVNTWN
jgi:transposase-like protein